MASRHLVWLRDPALVTQLKHYAVDQGVSVGRAAEQLLRAALQPTEPGTPGQGGSIISAPGLASLGVCRRCGHAKDKHFRLGCVAGCVCTEARYRA